MTDLADRDCIPCRGTVPPLDEVAVGRLVQELDSWQAEGVHHLYKDYRFGDFAAAKRFVDRISEVAEAENHHPDIWFTWGKARVEIRTHVIDGLTESDFILAAKIDRVTVE